MVTSGGDLLYEGEIVEYRITPMASNASQQSSQNRMTISINVRYSSKNSEDDNFEKRFSFYHDYDANLLPSVVLNEALEIIYERINRRVDKMLGEGLVDEVKSLLPYRNHLSLRTVGYSELFKFFDEEWTFDFAVEEIKKNSRRFAKRQLTWYRKEGDINWVNFENSMQESLSLLSNLNIKPKNS